MAARLENQQGVKPIRTSQDIVDIVQHAMEALQPEPKYPADDKQLVYDELATILDFLNVESR